MRHDLEIGYLVIEVPDPNSLTPVFADVVGLIPGSTTEPGAGAWRDDDRASRLIVTPGPANDAVAVGFEAVDADAFDTTVARLRAIGAAITDAADDAAGRNVTRMVRTKAPWGIDVEIVLGLADAPDPFVSELVPGGFLTDGVGFGHVVFATTAFDESHAFLVDGLGFAQSDWLETELAPGINLEVRFYH